MSQVTTAAKPKGWQQRIRESRFGTVLVLAVTAALVMVGAYMVNKPSAAQAGVSAVDVTAGSGPAPKVGAPAQDFTATTADGKQVSLSSYKGKAVWLTFGASWCAACVAEAPDIQAASEKFKASVVVLGVFINEDSSTVRDYAARVGLTFPIVADPDSKIAGEYRVYGIPAHFFIDKAGILRATKTGGLSPEQMATSLGDISR
jgi:cytochrome c biogenesis protein CcmG/thiol:disulfide interchange protein DsbE